jgi:putative ABC transport system permease protein
MNLWRSVRIAFCALSAHKLRSGLTMLGIIIGVSEVILLMSLVGGAQDHATEQVQRLGSNLIVVLSGTVTAGGAVLPRGTALTITEDDATAIRREVASVQTAAPVVRNGGQVVYGNANWSTPIQGITPEFFEAREWRVATGRLVSQEDSDARAKVVVLGLTVAEQLFGHQDPVGRVIRVRNVPFTVIGVLERKGQTSWGEDLDDVALVPLATAKTRLLGVNQGNARAVTSIIVKVRPGVLLEQAEEDLRVVLRERHRLRPTQNDDFWFQNFMLLLQTMDDLAGALKILLTAVAAISLVVGGVGIMNIMLVSVTERTREIGLRRAVGAHRRDILLQFLVEATALSLTGGLVGIAVGVTAAFAFAHVADWRAYVTPGTILLGFLFAGAVGIFFGFYPARKASRLDPIEALRYE